jgi:mannose-1-phosphate guanylyltransferase/mannose-6-phosphate isomerase
VIRDPNALAKCVAAGAARARDGALVTFGVTPDRAETGYGYLELSAPPEGAAALPLIRFVEKPDAATAEQMLASGRFLWNAGIFLFSAAAIIDAFRAHAPGLLAPCEAAVAKGRDDLCFFRLEEGAYASADSISIDYAVMEKAADLAVVPFDGGWNDLGSWATIWGESGGAVATTGEATAIDCENTLLRSEQEGVRLVGVGLRNIAAIAMRDAVLVADLTRAQEVKEAVLVLKAAKIDQAENFPRVHRPWGWYETLSLGNRFQVKRIMVHPGAVLSLQSHVHRAEHWVVVEGAAKVTVDDTVKLLGENESIYVPLGAVHRLANPGKVPLHLIEVQSGPYLGEDDIIRYEDIYARG